MNYKEGMTHIKCPYCGSEYILNNQKSNNEIQTIDYAGRGPLFETYVPKGWTLNIFDDNDSISSLSAICKGLQLSHNNHAQLIFYPFAFYKDGEMKSSLFSFGQAKSYEYQLDPFSLVCYSKFMEITTYAKRRIISICNKLAGNNVQITEINMLPCEDMKNMALSFRQDSTNKMKKPCIAAPLKVSFKCNINGQIYNGQFATILSHIENNSSNKNDWQDILKKGMSFMGAMYGIAGTGVFDWGRCFDLLLIYDDANEDYQAIFDKFLNNIKYGPVYFALQAEELYNCQQVQIQGAMTRQQNAIRNSQHISQTLSETTNIVNDALQSHSQQMNHIYDHASDGIRGVENYHDSKGNAYQADVKYDHIYKKGDRFIASSDGSLQLGPDWEELKK